MFGQGAIRTRISFFLLLFSFSIGSCGGKNGQQTKLASAKDAVISPTEQSNLKKPSGFSIENCSAVQRDTFTVDIRCEDYRLSFHSEVIGTPETALTEFMNENYQTIHNEKATENSATNQPLHLDYGELEGTYHKLSWTEGGNTSQNYAVLDTKNNAMQIATCNSSKPITKTTFLEACSPMLRQLLEHGVPQAILIKSTPATASGPLGTFAGKTLSVPDGCTRETAQSRWIKCDSGQLSWHEQRLSAVPLEQELEETNENIKQATEDPSVAEKSFRNIDCFIDGVPTTCTETFMRYVNGEIAFYFTALTTVRNEKVMAVCSWSEIGNWDLPPKPCDQIFTFKDDYITP